jgi:CRISPR-associated endonuclease/helicase Cas3
MARLVAEGAVWAFRELTRREPYKWQERLLCRWFLEGRLPEAIDIPTGLGKTTIMALWLAALAVGAKLPRRLIYIVDRRTVVDQATVEADKLASALGETEPNNPATKKLRRGLGLEKWQRMPISTLRGQHLDNRLWLENPAAPAIIVGTVDMIGSRLLFEGYGVSPRMRPVHAGLIGADVLVMLDEAHLVPPFAALLRSIADMTAPAPIPRFHIMTLSATGRQHSSQEGAEPDSFGLEPEDWEDAPVKARLDASKGLRLEDSVETKNLAARLADRAWQLGAGGKRVLVYCNRRTVAREVRNKIAEAADGNGLPEATELLVGARRVRERDELTKSRVFQRFDPSLASEQREVVDPAFLVATSAGEVGIDLDADHMVSDLVPWERMVQRLGRVNRTGRATRALIDVFPAEAEREVDPEINKDDLRKLKAPFESADWFAAADGRRDASPGVLHRVKDDPAMRPTLRAATSEEPLRPALTRAMVDAWSMTSLSVHPGRPDVEPWLRGWVENEPQTRILWRRLLPVRAGDDEKSRKKTLRKTLSDFFEYAPPHLSEILETLTREIVDTLQRRALQVKKVSRKIEAEPQILGPVILSARGEVDEVLSFHELAQPARLLSEKLAGRTIVVDARLGGLDSAGLLDPKVDCAPPTLDGDPDDPRGWGAEALQAAGFRVREVPADTGAEPDWPVEWRWRRDPDEDSEEGEELRVEVWRRSSATDGDAAIAKISQPLSEHHDWTASEADAIARGLELGEEYQKMLVAAAAVHDLGKARELWQRAMRAPPNNRPYAKTAGAGIPGLLEINGQTYRHEFGSLRDAENDPAIRQLPDELRDLALHLVAAHHGFARPVIAAVDPENAPSASAGLAREAALRFARLQAHWGPWGLAWWEALLRAADWAASRKLNESAARPEDR